MSSNRKEVKMDIQPSSSGKYKIIILLNMQIKKELTLLLRKKKYLNNKYENSLHN
jgi:hypothetical protein